MVAEALLHQSGVIVGTVWLRRSRGCQVALQRCKRLCVARRTVEGDAARQVADLTAEPQSVQRIDALCSAGCADIVVRQGPPERDGFVDAVGGAQRTGLAGEHLGAIVSVLGELEDAPVLGGGAGIVLLHSACARQFFQDFCPAAGAQAAKVDGLQLGDSRRGLIER